MAQSYTTPIRKSLRDKGISDSRIGYTGGQVTIDNKPFMQPNRTYAGSSFASPTNFNTAWNDYTKSQQQPTGAGAGVAAGLPAVPTTGANIGAGMGAARAGGVMGAGLPGAAAMGANIGGKPSGYTPQQAPSYQQQPGYFDQYNQMSQQPIDVYSTPQYQAYAAQSARRQQEGIRASQEALGSAGFGRSTVLGERAGRIAGEEQQYLETQVMPQLYAQEEARRQQQFANAMAMQQADRAYGLQTGELTGSFLPPEARQMIEYLNNFKATTEQNWMSMTPDQRTAAQNEGNRIRSQLQGMNIDPSLFGAGVRSTTAMGNVGRAGIQTEAAREFDEKMAYQESRDKIADERYKAKFDEDATRFGLKFALDEAVKSRQLSQNDARIAISRASEARQAKSSNLANLYNIWEATGVAPEGIPGVRAGTPIYEKPTAAQKEASFIGPPVATEAPKEKPIDAKDSLDNYDYYTNELLNSKDMTLAEANKYIEGEKAFLTDKDYRKLKEDAKKYFK